MKTTTRPTYRDCSNFYIDSFKDELNNKLNEFNNKNLFACTDTGTPNKIYTDFVTIIKQTIDTHAPLKLALRKYKNCLHDPGLPKVF